MLFDVDGKGIAEPLKFILSGVIALVAFLKDLLEDIGKCFVNDGVLHEGEFVIGNALLTYHIDKIH